MERANDYASVMGRKAEIMLKSVGIDYSKFESGSIAFDYEKMMRETGYTLEEMQNIQYSVNVGNTPILELKTSPPWPEPVLPPEKGHESLSRMKRPTLPEALKPEEPPMRSTMPRSWAIRGSSLPPAAITELLLPLRRLLPD
jgi:hypothetical protein